MNYEKKYKEALEKAREIIKDYENRGLKDNLFYANEDFEAIFPELKESEDEKTRKWLIDWAKAVNWSEQFTVTKEQVLAWLERQGEKPTLPKWKYKKDHTPLLRDSIILNKYGGVAKSPSGAIVSDVWVIDYDELAKLPKEELEKQGEKKPVWSEEDERNLKGIIDEIEANKNTAPDYDLATYDRFLSWLKSIKERVQPQNTWKPSDAQMASNTCAVRKMKESACYDSELVSLYQDLKKLKG